MQCYASTYPFSYTSRAAVRYHHAYLASIGRFAEMAGPMLLCDHADLVGEQDVVVWLQDPNALADLVHIYHAELQSVYTDASDFGAPPGPGRTDASDSEPAARQKPSVTTHKPPLDKTMSAHYALESPEPLARAQTPPIDWKPDGVDVLKWLHIPA